MSEPLFVAFSTQKGGAGKTTLTVLTASYLHYVKGYNVAVVDCDYPQYSIKDMRERDLKRIEKNEYCRSLAYEQFTRLQKRAYSIIGSKPEEAITEAQDAVKKDKTLDFVFFDLPGTIYNAAVIQTIATMDFIVCPVTADRVVMESSLRFSTLVNDHLMRTGKSNIKGLYMLWNMVDKRERTELYELFEKVSGELGIPILKTTIPDSKRFRREAMEEGEKRIFRSTLFPPDKQLMKGSNLEELVAELLSLLKP